jgi:2-polyprenyl-3-methyl-5-hydroxy-6-metoxy-1,4-benzoquinol methylase
MSVQGRCSRASGRSPQCGVVKNKTRALDIGCAVGAAAPRIAHSTAIVRAASSRRSAKRPPLRRGGAS